MAQSTASPFINLPTEVHLLIVEHCDRASKVSLYQANKYLRFLVNVQTPGDATQQVPFLKGYELWPQQQAAVPKTASKKACAFASGADCQSASKPNGACFDSGKCLGIKEFEVVRAVHCPECGRRRGLRDIGPERNAAPQTAHGYEDDSAEGTSTQNFEDNLRNLLV
ncbi:hypothetical protein CNMCM7927_004579 [Aspergillus lentulus]|nr:hypothetical protein CNMCM7927_004579 [Aspergillus lentulus]